MAAQKLTSILKRIAKDISPPILWRLALGLKRSTRRLRIKAGKFHFGVEQPSEFYDLTFHETEHLAQHYSESHYYPLWTLIADRVSRLGTTKVLDIGCGAGQVACVLRDIGLPNYVGIDFSASRINQARLVCPEYEFVQANIFDTDVLNAPDYDLVLSLEFLEHIDRDIDVIKRIRSGVRIIATVPNFPAWGHVRHFASKEEVSSRYAQYFESFYVTAVIANQKGLTYFVLQGVRTEFENMRAAPIAEVN